MAGVNEDLYAALSAAPGLTANTVFDTVLPPDYQITGAVAVFQSVSDTPEVYIDSSIGTRAQRWQVSIMAPKIGDARNVKTAAITALHGLRSNTVKYCEFESAPGELYEPDGQPPYHHIPIDFMLYV